MSPEHQAALTMAYELQATLEKLMDLPENGEGSCVEDAFNRMADVIGMLEPLAPEEPDDKPRLRLVS